MTGLIDESRISAKLLERLAAVKVFLMDVDGVLTAGTIQFVLDASGKAVEMKGFNSQDGLGLYLLHSAGIKTGVISGRNSPAVVERACQLNMTYVYQGLMDKKGAFAEILADAGVSEEFVCFVGDDFPDSPLMRRAGLSVAVANARPEVKCIADFVTEKQGGDGAIREVCELILKAQGHWQSVLVKYDLT